jgi:ABC-type lipoprotein export system ATPase subunit
MEIELKGVTKYYYDQGKSTKGIEDVNLDFKTDGSWVAVTGESGAGKSTLIKILTGLEDFDEGDIYFDGKPLTGMSDGQRQKLYTDNISFVFQDYNLVESVTAQQNIALALLKQGFSVEESNKKAFEVLKTVGLEKQARMRASKLSGGERQRVAIARSLALEAKVIIFDEPTGNLDNDTSKQIIDLIESVKGNRLIVYVTHDYDEVKQYVTRHITLADGKVIKDEKVAEPAGESQAAEEQKSKRKFGFKSYLYASSLFCFSRFGRFLATFIVMLFSIVGILGQAFGFSEVLYQSGNFTNYLSGLSLNNYSYSAFGNKTAVRKAKYEEAEILPDSQFYFKDEGGLVFDDAFSLYNPQTVDEQITSGQSVTLTPLVYRISVESLFSMPTSLFPYEVLEGTVSDEEGIYLALPKTNYVRQTENYYNLKPLVGKEIEFSKSLGGLSFSSKNASYVSLLKKEPRLKVKGLLAIDNQDALSYSSVMALCDKTSLTALHDYSVYSFMEYGESTHYHSVASYYDNYTFDNSISCLDGNSKVGASNYLYWSLSEEQQGASKLYLSSDLKGKNLTFKLYEMTLPLSYFESLNEVEYIDVSTLPAPSSSDYRNYIKAPCYTAGANYLSLRFMQSGAFASYEFSSAKEASAFASKVASSQGSYSSFYYKTKAEVTLKKMPNLADMDISLRISLMAGFSTSLVFVILVMLVLRLILNKYYYRKDYDQMVLSYIGYSYKDTVLINVLQFVSISLFIMAFVYPLFIFYAPDCLTIMSIFPGLIILSIFVNLLFAFLVALPKRLRGGKK